jgi:hypothetical protein
MCDQFPEGLRPKFDYLRHELSLRKGQELTAREINFLLARIQKIDVNWSGPAISASPGNRGINAA